MQHVGLNIVGLDTCNRLAQPGNKNRISNRVIFHIMGTLWELLGGLAYMCFLQKSSLNCDRSTYRCDVFFDDLENDH